MLYPEKLSLKIDVEKNKLFQYKHYLRLLSGNESQHFRKYSDRG